MRPRRAGGFWHWIRTNLFDGWQVAGTIGLLLGVALGAGLIMHAKHHLPSTGAAIRLVQTFGTEAEHLVPGLSSSPEPSATVTPDSTGGAVSQPLPAVQPSRPIRRPAPVATSQPGSPGPTAAPTATPTPTPTPTSRPCVFKVCPTPTPTPH